VGEVWNDRQGSRRSPQGQRREYTGDAADESIWACRVADRTHDQPTETEEVISGDLVVFVLERGVLWDGVGDGVSGLKDGLRFR